MVGVRLVKRKDIVGKINSLLGTKLELRKAALKDLEELRRAISAKLGNATGLPLGQNLKGFLNTPLVEILRKRLSHKKLEELTLKDLMSAIQEGTEDKGILGLGILPRLLGSGRRK